MGIVLVRVEKATDEARALIVALDAELAGPYTCDQRHALKIEQIFQPRVRFFVARLDGATAGCGAVASEDGFAELKRMYVRPDMRGQGVVQAVLARLEKEAASQGFSRLRLETGDAQFAAIKAYERAGYRRCGAFGDYLDMEPHTIARSVFMEKTIG